jgi:hypothetical protein
VHVLRTNRNRDVLFIFTTPYDKTSVILELTSSVLVYGSSLGKHPTIGPVILWGSLRLTLNLERLKLEAMKIIAFLFGP